MDLGVISNEIDGTVILLSAFTLFFFALVFYLQRESRREGYPLEYDTKPGQYDTADSAWIPPVKTFELFHGGESESHRPDKREHNMRRVAVWDGSPYEPVGNPLTAGVGPGSYADRADTPDLTREGEPRIVPMRLAEGFSIVKGVSDPRGWTVVGADNAPAGKVSDLWVDRADHLTRFLEVDLDAEADEPGSGKVLAPIVMIDVDKERRVIRVDAILGEQFADVPRTASAEQITLLEEEKITAYYAAGTLYATPQRLEPLL
ncbi:MAG: photosynthetic reaction center subunit H [Maricaulaceae bacterium]